MGMIYKRGKVWWVKFYKDGRPVRETVRGAMLGDRTIATGLKETEAKRLLKLREGSGEQGMPVSPKVGRLTVDAGLAAVITDFQVNGKKSLDDVEQRIRSHLLPAFGGRRMSSITTDAVREYQAARQAAGASNATINREVALFKRAFTLAVQAGTLIVRPYLPMLKESDPRAGFFEQEQLDAVVSNLPEPLRPMIRFASLTGWRIPTEVLLLQWRNVDLTAGTITLDPGTTKNKQGRVFPFTLALRTLLVAQREATDVLQRERGIIVPSVFHWNDGRRIRSYWASWQKAVRAAGCPARIPHDLRRTVARNFERAGIPRAVAMQLLGHKTESVYLRYNVTAAADLRVAAERLDAVQATR
jgi:integrase